MFEQSKENCKLKILMNKSLSCQNLSLQMVSLGGLTETFQLTILCEFQCSFINQVLNFVLQLPTVVSIMPRAVGMVCTPCIRIVVRRRSLGIRMRSYQRHQILSQQVLHSLGQRHVELGKLLLGPIRLTLINRLFMARLLLDPWGSSNLERSILYQTKSLSS